MSNYSYEELIKRLYWDLISKDERQYYFYHLISQIPGLFGDMLRAKFVSRRCKQTGRNFKVLAGTRFRSMENLIVGDNVTIGFDNFIQAWGGVTIGNNVMTAPGVKIWSVNHNYKKKDTLVSEQGYTNASVTIGNDVWLASNVFITPGVHLPDGMIVFSGAVVGAKDYKPYGILAGNPARLIGYREQISDV